MKKSSILRTILAGAVSGIAATLVMDRFLKLSSSTQKTVEKLERASQGESLDQIEQQQANQAAEAAQQEDSTEIVARKLAAALGQSLPSECKAAAGRAVHYTFGTSIGILYAASTHFAPEVATGAGTAFGTFLFLGADGIAVPALHLAPPPTETPASSHLEHWAAHVVYGLTLELSLTLLKRLA